MQEYRRVAELMRSAPGWACLIVTLALPCRAGAAELKFEPYNLEMTGQQRISGQFARLTVPERHGDPSGKQIELQLRDASGPRRASPAR
jgi:hypothetical protein